MWIYKPKNDYGGSGCHVYNISMPQFHEVLKRDTQKRRNFVLQRYIENPLLVGGYKFHMRIFLLLTSMNPPCGYLHHGGQVLFSTKKYSYDHSTLGANFDKYAHLTNWSIHSLPNNYDRLLAKKDVIGVGCEWRFKRLIRHLKKEHPNFKESGMREKKSIKLKFILHFITPKNRYVETVKSHWPRDSESNYEVNLKSLRLIHLNLFLLSVTTHANDMPRKWCLVVILKCMAWMFSWTTNSSCGS